MCQLSFYYKSNANVIGVSIILSGSLICQPVESSSLLHIWDRSIYYCIYYLVKCCCSLPESFQDLGIKCWGSFVKLSCFRYWQSFFLEHCLNLKYTTHLDYLHFAHNASSLDFATIYCHYSSSTM